ncbi:hypothetical protein [Nostoc sp.]|uniref:hypothetical protein n=1 Tax=Nostoc sp. TaxID=1180 RepID=UPI002FF7152A
MVVRSDKQNLNQLLSQTLGNFIAFEPNQISASGFAIAALGDDNLGYFQLDERQFRVVKRQVKMSDNWVNKWRIHELSTLYRRVLNNANDSSYLPK